ncbi:MAG: hypothetical protein IPH23_04405 [Gammaproteobacteria bacterium]|nr:hypothetical protein [Gammaproteobacteria bacterium]
MNHVLDSGHHAHQGFAPDHGFSRRLNQRQAAQPAGARMGAGHGKPYQRRAAREPEHAPATKAMRDQTTSARPANAPRNWLVE